MAHIEAAFFNMRFEDEEFNEKMITALTNAVASVLGEDAGKEAQEGAFPLTTFPR